MKKPGAVRWTIISVIVVLLLAGCYTFSSLPNISGMVAAAEMSPLLLIGGRRADMVRYFQEHYLAWHNGDQLQRGQFFSFKDMGTCSSVSCQRAVQVAFPYWSGLCEESFRVYTLHFDASGMLESWKQFDSGNAC